MAGRNALTDELRQVCDDALAVLVPGPGRTMVAQVREKLGEPLTVTIAGGVSSGKSTLVNALLGQQVAAVDAGECTRVVTEFRYGVPERAEVIGTDGTSETRPLERGRVPASLGRPVEQVRSVVVHLSNALLTELAVVDTPGLNTVTEVNEATTANFLGVTGDEGVRTAESIGRADTLLFLLPLLRQADSEVLRGFARLFGDSALSAATSIAVLSKIDRLNKGGDPIAAAAPIAARIATDLRGVVSGVFPVIGLLAQTCRAAVFTEADARALLEVAAVTDEFDREDMLLSPEDFLRFPGLSLDVPARKRLLGMLDLYGITVAIHAIDQGAQTASGILRVLEACSGFERLRAEVIGRFGRQAEVFKAHAAISDLRRASYRRDDADNARALRALRAPLERIELDPTMHRLRLLAVAHAVASGELRLGEQLLDDIRVLTAPADPGAAVSAEVAGAEAARDGAMRWAAWGNDPRRSPTEARHARTVKEAFELAWSELERRAR